jgi:hypothetical protein
MMPITGRIVHACVYQNRWFLSHAKKTKQFKELNELLINKHKELKVAKEKSQDYGMEM